MAQSGVQAGVYKKVVKQKWGKNRKRVSARSKQKQLDKVEIKDNLN